MKYRNLALFDLDHTLLPLDSDQAWTRFFSGLGLDSADANRPAEIDSYYAQYMAGTLDMQAYLDYTLAPLARHPRKQLEHWHTEFMREVIRPAIQPAALNLVNAHREAGDLCCIVTAANVFVTGPIAKTLGVPHLLGIELETYHADPEGDYTGKSVGVHSFREGKIQRTEAWLASLGMSWQDFEKSYFYSDSINDLPLMEYVTDPVATNPDARLRAIAKQRHWPIRDLFVS